MESLKVKHNRLALDRLVSGEVCKPNQAAIALHIRYQSSCGFTAIEISRTSVGKTCQRFRQRRLMDDLSFLFQKDAVGSIVKYLAAPANYTLQSSGGCKTLLCQFNGRLRYLCTCQFSIMRNQPVNARDQARNAR